MHTSDDKTGFAPNQVEYDLTDAEKSQAAIYRLDLERSRRKRNLMDEKQAELKRNRELQAALYGDDGPEAA